MAAVEPFLRLLYSKKYIVIVKEGLYLLSKQLAAKIAFIYERLHSIRPVTPKFHCLEAGATFRVE